MTEQIQVNIRFPSDVHDQIKKLAASQERSFNGQIIWALRQHLKGHGTIPEVDTLEYTVREVENEPF